MNANILIKGAQIVDAFRVLEGDLLIQDGRIRAVSKNINGLKVPILDAQRKVLMPAFVDLHAHFRDPPGRADKEDIFSGSRAAARGGYTVVSLMANTKPVCDSVERARYVRRKAQQAGLVEVFIVGAITKGLKGEELTDMEKLAPWVWAFSDDGKGVASDKLAEQACQKTLKIRRTLIEHCQMPQIDNPQKAETMMVVRDITLAQQIGCRLHVAHISAPESVRAVSLAKKAGAPVTAEVTPHHLCLSDSIYYLVNPPLPTERTRRFLVKSLREGIIDAIATDHAPHSLQDKQKGAPGINGLELAFSLLFTKLVKNGDLSLPELSKYMSFNPASILGIPKGRIKTGYDGDVVIIDLEDSFMVREKDFLSRSYNTPLIGQVLFGKILATVHKGKIIYLDGQISQSKDNSILYRS